MKPLRFLFLILFLLTILGCSPQPRETPLNNDLALAWTTQTDGAINHPPLIVGGTVILAPSGSPLLALDLETGAARWTFAPPEGIWERAYASDGKRVFVGLKNKTIAALDISNGKVIWQTAIPVMS